MSEVSNTPKRLLGYGIWPKDSSTRLFPWTRDFIVCHGWRVYFWDILWHSIIRSLWPRFVCRLRGHEWKEHEWHEWVGYPVLTEHWRDCQRCERYEDLT